MTELVLYDIPGRNVACKAWSPRVWITRFALNHKGIKYKTVWVEFPDIEAVCKKIGAAPTATKRDGVTSHYTVPVIYDPTTRAVISDSARIAEYLDEAFPDTPPLLPLAIRGLTAAFSDALVAAVSPSLYYFCVLPTFHNLNDASKEYYRTMRETRFGKTLEEIVPEGEITEKYWAQLEAGLLKVAGWFKANGDKPFIGGDELCHGDILLAARLMYPKVVWGADSKGWKRLSEFDGARWGRYMQRFEEYSAVV